MVKFDVANEKAICLLTKKKKEKKGAWRFADKDEMIVEIGTGFAFNVTPALPWLFHELRCVKKRIRGNLLYFVFIPIMTTR